MSNDDRGYRPKWGELAIEQYMRHWDFAVGPVSGAGYKRYPSSEIVDMSRAQFKVCLAKAKQNEPDRWREDPHGWIEVEGADLLRTVAAAYILVADQTAFETGHVRLIYVDGERNVIRETRFDTQTITDVIMDWAQLNLPPGVVGGRHYRGEVPRHWGFGKGVLSIERG
ncbi:hypothetical protein PENANT_c052G11411 [Penicillium antarcticum]|uniref:Uncharacterized protein n=1 Tax=Penicillium antarcticum TaxID=416450 RepID=A0A1V6PQV3_9EURO|nr:uncharacterized protein N7508_002686 [Penicillium antarcticum]KAJ5318178.1 hypothetical protein N7508_002686 [Penicillium antarcticum]OQD79420.1 hypothetical protein PENANT_c052G11411 [Penicillium antarcticum]